MTAGQHYLWAAISAIILLFIYIIDMTIIGHPLGFLFIMFLFMSVGINVALAQLKQ